MLFRHQTHDGDLLCLDIGTSSVKACVFHEEKDELQLKGMGIVAQERGNVEGGSIVDLSRTVEKVQAAVRLAENKAKIHPKNLVLGVSGELIKGITMHLEYKREHPNKRITAQELKTILYELQWHAFEEIRQKISDELSIPLIELKLINASVVSVQVDGEDINDPKGMTGKVVSMDLYNCFSPLQHFGQLQSITVELPYHEFKGVFIQSFAICHSLTLRNTLESALVIDIGAGTTDLCLVEDGKIIGNRSFSLAGTSLTKRISYELSTSFDDAEAVKINYVEDQLEKKSHQAVEEALKPDFDIWLSSLEFSLKELPFQKLPRKILLCGLSSRMSEFEQILKDHDWTNHFPVSGSVHVRQLQYHDILEGEFDDSQFDIQFLPLMGVANTAFDLLFNNSSLDAILNTIIADKGI
jgi:cell division protein FtsA